MLCKMSTVFLVLVSSALMTDAILYTLAGLAVDSALAFLVFTKFMALPVVFVGKRSVENPVALSRATPDEYLSVAAAIDTDKCLPMAVCAAMARTRDVNSQKTKFDSLIIDTFTKKINEPMSDDKISPLNFYVEAAKFGQTIGVVESCRMVSPTCKYSIAELSQLTASVSQYQL